MENAEWRRASNKNIATIEWEINSLKSNYVNSFKEDYKGFWAQVRHINGLFKTLKPMDRDERQKLWEIFSAICEDTKRRSSNESLKKASQSKGKLDGIRDLIKDAYFQAKGGTTREELTTAKEMLQQALARMKDGWGGYNLPTELVSSILGDDGILSKEDRDYCWAKWKEASDTINYRWNELSNLNYNECIKDAWNALSSANDGDPYEAQEKVKNLQSKMKGKLILKERREEIFGVLDRAWQAASNKIREKKEEKVKKQSEWRDRMHSHLQRWENQISNTETLIDRIRGQIDDLEGKASCARTAEFADRVRGWIQEKYDFINKLQDQIREIENKIGSVKDKLST